MYLGFSHLHSFLSSIFAGLSGFLLSKYCPARELFSSEADWMAASANAHYIWYYFAAIALVSAVALIIYGESGTSVGCEEGGSNTIKFIY